MLAYSLISLDPILRKIHSVSQEPSDVVSVFLSLKRKRICPETWSQTRSIGLLQHQKKSIHPSRWASVAASVPPYGAVASAAIYHSHKREASVFYSRQTRPANARSSSQDFVTKSLSRSKNERVTAGRRASRATTGHRARTGEEVLDRSNRRIHDKGRRNGAKSDPPE